MSSGSIVDKKKERLTKSTLECGLVKPPIKWVGGKTQIIEEVIDNFPSEIHNFHEIFLGGGSVLIALLSSYGYINKKDKQNKQCARIKITGKIRAFDINKDLIYMFRNIRNNPTELCKELGKIRKLFFNLDRPEKKSKASSEESSEEENGKTKRKQIEVPKTRKEASKSDQERFYYWIRQQYNLNRNDEVKRKGVLNSAMFIFLNKTCFRGVYREGPTGFNVPYGNYANPQIYDKNHLLVLSELFKNYKVKFECRSFTKSIKGLGVGDFIYMDPPYAPETKTSFVGYVSDGFDIEKHEKLFKMTQKICEDGAQFLMNNADVALVRKYFVKEKENKNKSVKVEKTKKSEKEKCICKYYVHKLEAKRSIHSKDPSSTTTEVIIKNYKL